METGATIGTHQGLWTYTIGQGARLPGLKEKYFVAAKNKKENAIYAVNGS
jgi:tRNA U34 2-thiouridine synthase MnmA/TrmU